MCRTYYVGALNGGALGVNGYNIHFNYLFNSHGNNRDGYAFYSPAMEHRSLNFRETVNKLEGHKAAIKNSNFIAGHARASTNKVCDEFVHGWEFNGFRCYHNGVITMDTSQSENDSLNFFKEVFRRKKKGLVHEIKRTVRQHVKSGWGAFLLISPVNKYVVCINKEVNIHIINGELLALNSQDDIHKFKKSIHMTRDREVNFWGLKFKKTEDKYMECAVEVCEDMTTAVDDCIVVIDRNNKIVQVIPLKEKVSAYAYQSQATIKDFRNNECDKKENINLGYSNWENYPKRVDLEYGYMD
jgi:hypothetical protein